MPDRTSTSGPRFRTLEEALALHRDRIEREPRAQRGAETWIIEVGNLSLCLLDGTANAWHLSMFWIRLFGLVSDLAAAWRSALESDAGDEQRRHALTQASSIVDALIASMSEAERMVLEYRRHFEAHPLQNGYRVRERDGRLITARRPALLEEQYTFDAHDAAFRDLLAAHGSEMRVAAVLARKALPSVEALLPLARGIYGGGSR